MAKNCLKVPFLFSKGKVEVTSSECVSNDYDLQEDGLVVGYPQPMPSAHCSSAEEYFAILQSFQHVVQIW